jgi:HD-GYP domain-containing protein (c-di-GMP phosphodiesterase class II)
MASRHGQPRLRLRRRRFAGIVPALEGSGMVNDQETLNRLEALNAIGAALSSEQDLDSLLERILETARKFARADGGTLYRVRGDDLVFEVMRNDSLGYFLGGRHGAPVHFPPLPMHDAQGRDNHGTVVVHAALTGQTINIADAYDAPGYDFSGTRAFDARTGYRSQSFLTVPMRDHEGKVIGVLQLINASGASGGVDAFGQAEQRLVESLASQAACALNTRLLISQLEALFESLINLINTAIDEKSPYTGGHCERVPVLTTLLAEAAARTRTGPLASFQMSPKDRYELKIAGLLHDCGKITTPVHVVDKATKLQTLFDRIELLDTRFEVLLRDAEIAWLRGGLDEAAYQARTAQLRDDRDFLRQCNIGSEHLADESVARIYRIAGERWSAPDGRQHPLLSADEVENLSIRRGTLNAAEREVINHHITMSIRLLEALPWPEHLRHVPEYAGGHHERMDGKGYPRGLTREQMSVQARVMGVADIFEALTASDRPYKPGKTLSESITILGRMAVDQHVDADLFEVFVRERVYLDYARRFLPPSQIDAVDWSRVPGVSAALAAELTAQDLAAG